MGSLAATRLLTRLLLLRLKNLVLSAFPRGATTASRAATAGKGGASWVLLSLCLFLWVPALVSTMFDVTSNLRLGVASQLVEANQADEPGDPGFTGRPVPSRVLVPAEEGMTEATAMLVAVGWFTLCTLLMGLHALLMAPDLWRVEWSFEWLFTLPLSVPVLMLVRTVASTLSNLAGYFLVAPLLGVIAWDAGWRWMAPPLAILMATPLIALLAAARQVFEVTLRLACEPARLRNLQALVTLGGFVLWLPAMFALSPAAQEPDHAVFLYLRAAPAAVRFTPPGLAVTALTAVSPSRALAHAAGLAVEVCALMALAFAFLDRRLAHGLVATGGRESARVVRARLPLPPPRRGLTAFQAKTLTLLSRDRNMAVTVFGLPAFVIAQQYLLFGDVSSLAAPERVCAAAFAVGAMALAMALPQVILKEAETFWLLKTFPRAIEVLLLENAVLWGGMMTVYPVIGLGLGMRHVSAPPLVWMELGLLVILGMAAYTITATGLAVLSSTPTAADPRKQLSPWGMWLFMILVGVYLQALVSGDPWRMLGGLTLAVMLAGAFWQKTCDHLPYMLDPSAEPPPRVSLADGLIAAEVFFILQAVALAGMRVTAPTLRQLLPSFTLAGGLTCTLVLASVWHLRMAGVPRLGGPGWRRALLESSFGGAAAGAFGLAWMWLLRHSARLAHLVPTEPPVPRDELGLLLVLGVVAAPVFEELIFRGLIHTGLRRSLPLAGAVFAGALLFAVLHPVHAFVPVFVMAVIATVLYERHGVLLASIVTHAVYNACVLFV